MVQTVTQSADLVGGAPLMQDTSKPCDTISVGLGFVAKPTGAPTKVAAPLVVPGGGC